ncbi:TRAP transporter large permease subunit, partial [Mycobacterium tuberculosis]|nr:TRAP transporter large permease subunit [Mycobacterium tuberculosis]
FQALPERLLGSVMANETLLAIPFFTFMGLVLERSGMAEKLLDTVGKLFGPVRGGVAYAVVFVGALLAATTGVVAASVIAMGLI